MDSIVTRWWMSRQTSKTYAALQHFGLRTHNTDCTTSSTSKNSKCFSHMHMPFLVYNFFLSTHNLHKIVIVVVVVLIWLRSVVNGVENIECYSFLDFLYCCLFISIKQWTTKLNRIYRIPKPQCVLVLSMWSILSRFSYLYTQNMPDYVMIC